MIQFLVMLRNYLPVFFLIFLAGCVATQQAVQTTPEVPSSPEGQTTLPETQNQVTIQMVARQFEFEPNIIRVNKGDLVRIEITSEDVVHGFALPAFGINVPVQPGQTTVVEFVADKTGSFEFYCSIYCGAGHSQMRGTLIVE